MSETDTPRTFAEAKAIRTSGVDWHYSATLMQQHAQKLERESDALRRGLEEAKDANKRANQALGDIANECSGYVAKLAAAQKEIERLQRIKLFGKCAYCLKEFPDTTKESGKAALLAHVAECEKNPIQELKRDKERLDWLQGFQGDLEMWPLGGPLNSDKTNFNIHARGVGFLSESDDVRTAIDAAIAKANAHV